MGNGNWHDDRGTTAIEYAMIAAAIGMFILAAAAMMGDSVSRTIGHVADGAQPTASQAGSPAAPVAPPAAPPILPDPEPLAPVPPAPGGAIGSSPNPDAKPATPGSTGGNGTEPGSGDTATGGTTP